MSNIRELDYLGRALKVKNIDDTKISPYWMVTSVKIEKGIYYFSIEPLFKRRESKFAKIVDIKYIEDILQVYSPDDSKILDRESLLVTNFFSLEDIPFAFGAIAISSIIINGVIVGVMSGKASTSDMSHIAFISLILITLMLTIMLIRNLIKINSIKKLRCLK